MLRDPGSLTRSSDRDVIAERGLDRGTIVFTNLTETVIVTGYPDAVLAAPFVYR